MSGPLDLGLEARAAEQLTAAPDLTLYDIPPHHVLIVAGLIEKGLAAYLETSTAPPEDRAVVEMAAWLMLRNFRAPFVGLPDVLAVFDGIGQ